MNGQLRASRLLLPLAGLMLMAATTEAHHSFQAFFDPDKPVSLTGTVTKFEWENPHAWIYMNVDKEGGGTEKWGFELGSPNSLVRRGWAWDSLKEGDRITIDGVRAKDGTLRAAVRIVTQLSTGKQLFGAQNEGK